MRNWFKTTLATFYPRVTNSLGKTVKVPPRCVLAVKHLWLACLILNIEKRHRKYLLISTSASNDIPVPLATLPQGEGWRQWRRNSGARLGVEWVGPKELPTYQLHTLKNKEQLSRSDSSDKMCISSKRLGHFWLACYSICLGPRTEKPLMAPQVASQHKAVAQQRGRQQVRPTCQPCPCPVNMKCSCVVHSTDTWCNLHNVKYC